MPNNNVAILSIMSKFDEKSAREAAKRADKVYEEALSDIGNVNFDKKLIENFDKAMNLLKNKFKRVNLSSYTNSLLDSIFSDKDIKEKSEDIELFISKIEMLKKASSGQDINAFNTFSAKQIDALISRTEKLAEKQEEINEKTREYSREATKIAKANRNISTIDKNYGNQDYSKILESLKKSLGAEKEFTAEQNQSIENLAKMVNLYQIMERSEPQKGTAEAIRYSKDLLAVTRKIKEERDKIDAFAQKGASTYITNNGLSSVDKVSDYTVNKSKEDFVKSSLSNLKSQEAKLQSELTTYISDSVQKNLAKVSKEVDAVVDKAEKRVENLQNKIESLQTKSTKTGSDNSMIGGIVSETDIKSLEEIEDRLYAISDLDAEGEATKQQLKEYIQLYKQYEQLVASDSTVKFDPGLKEEYDFILESDSKLKEYADTLDETITKQETLFNSEFNNNTDTTERTEQLAKQEEQAKETIKSEEELAKFQKESVNSSTYTNIESDINDIKIGISEIKETISSLDNIDSFEQISSQVKDVTENIDILKEKIIILFDSFKSTKEIEALSVLIHGGNLDILNSSEYKRSDALLKNMQNIFSGSGSDYGMVTGGGIFGLNDMSGIDKTDVNPNAKWYAIDYSKYHTYMVETEQEAEELNQFMQRLNLMVVKNLGVDGKYIAPSFQDMYNNVDIDGLFLEYQQSFKGANLSLDEFKNAINEITERVKKAGFELYNDDEYSYTGKNARVSQEHAYDDDISTMFYKKHGYQGFNAQKLKDSDYNSYVCGSTIFDIDKENPYFKVFETYEEAVEYMKQVRDKIDNNQTVFYEYVEKSNGKYKEELEETNRLLQEQSRLIDEIQRKLSNQSNSKNATPFPSDDKTNISSENISAVQQQEKIENDIVESIREQNKAIDETIKKTLTLNDVRQKQYEIIQKTNPRWEDSNSFWLTKPSDAKTYYEVAHEDSDWDFNDDYTDDYTVKDKMNIEKAVLNGEMITVYSSKPIVDGNFVTPSKEYAQSYADDGRTVYEAQIDPRDIAWLDVGEGQVAHLSDELKEVILLETQAKMGLIDLSEQNQAVSSDIPIKDVFQGGTDSNTRVKADVFEQVSEQALQAKKSIEEVKSVLKDFLLKYADDDNFVSSKLGWENFNKTQFIQEWLDSKLDIDRYLDILGDDVFKFNASTTDASTTAIKEESQALEQVSTSAKEAADAKKEFVEANKQVKDSVADTNEEKKSKNTEENANAWKELTYSIQRYSEVSKRISSGKALEGDIEEASRLENKISQLQKLDILSPTQAEKSEQMLIKLYDSLDDIEKKSKETTLESLNSSINKYRNDYNSRSSKPFIDNQSDQYKKLLANYETSIEKLEAYRDKISNSPLVSKEDLNQIDELTKKVKESATEFNSLTASQKGSTPLSRGKAIEWANDLLEQNSKWSKKAKIEVQGWINKLATADPSNVEEIRNRILEVVRAEREAGNAGKTWLDIFSTKKLHSFLGQAASMFSFYDLIRYGREGIDTIREFDDGLTKISYTMDITKSQLNDLGKSVLDMANDLDSSINNAMQVSQIYANMNTSAEEIKKLSEPTLILSNLTGFDASTVADDIQAVTQQFNIAAEDSMHIADVYDQISRNISVDYSKGIESIAEAVQVAGSTADQAGLSFEQLASIVGKTVEKTRLEGSQVGNGLKTIMTRLSKVGELSEEVDNETLSQASESLKKVGIEVYNLDGSYRQFDVIMGELAGKWDSLTDAEKSNISFNIAATRQTNLLSAVLSNFSDSMQLAEEATNANGNALENNQKWVDSFGGHLQSLENTAKSAWINILDSETIKGGVDILNSLLKVVVGLIDKFGVLGTTAIVGGGILGGKNLGKTYKCTVFKLNCFEYALYA